MSESPKAKNLPATRRSFLSAGVAAAFALSNTRLFAADGKQVGLTALSMLDVIEGTKAGRVDPVAYVDALLERNTRLVVLNAFISQDAEQMKAEAQALAARLQRRAELGPLGGAVIAFKDNIDVKGYATTGGTPGLQDWHPPADAPVAAAVRAADALVGGKTNMHELALGITSNNAHAGAVRNPYDPRLIAGGSSGGTAVAVSAGLVTAGLGTDTGGSCRIPAAHCGIVGFRPTLHRYSQRGIVPISTTRDTPGPMARSVRDVVALDAVCAVRRQAPTSVVLKGLRLGVPRQYFYDNLDSDLELVVEASLSRLRRAGAILVEVDLPSVGVLTDAAGFAIAMYEQPRELSAYLYYSGLPFNAHHVISQVAGKNERERLMQELDGASTLASEVYQAAMGVHRPILQRTYASYFADNDLAAMVVPTTPMPARPIGQEDTVELNGKQVPTFPTYIRSTDPPSVAGLPCLTVPGGLTGSGLPVGVEFVGPNDSDARVLAIGAEFEKLGAPVAGPPV